MPNKGQCKLCTGYFPLDQGGRLVAHRHIGTKKPCRGQWPATSRPDQYPVGFDSEPRWVMPGGLPTLGKGHR